MREKRLRYFGKMWLENMLWPILSALVMTAIFFIFEAKELTLQNLAMQLGISSVCIAAVLLMAQFFKGYQDMGEMMVSLGVRRFEIFVNFWLLKLATALGITLFALVLVKIGGYERGALLTEGGICFLLVLGEGSIGNLLGALYRKIGAAALVPFLICCGASGGFIGMLVGEGFAGYVPDPGDLLVRAALVNVSVVILLDLVFSWPLMRRLEVRN